MDCSPLIIYKINDKLLFIINLIKLLVLDVFYPQNANHTY